MRKLALLLVLLASPALAQQPQTPEVEALSQRLIAEINASLQCSAGLISAKREIERLTAELAQLREEKIRAKQKPGSSAPNGGGGSQPEVR